MNAIIFGATGLVGSHLINQLLEKSFYENITLVVRTPSKIKHKSPAIKIISFDDFFQDESLRFDHYYCSLGTTIKKAGSKESFKEVDFQLVIDTLKKSLKFGVKKAGIVSALGANESSPFFYNQVKGEMEKEVKKLKEDAIIVRPSLIDGDRDEKRILEAIGMNIMHFINPLMLGSLKKYRSIKAKDIARAMIELINQEKTSIDIEYI